MPIGPVSPKDMGRAGRGTSSGGSYGKGVSKGTVAAKGIGKAKPKAKGLTAAEVKTLRQARRRLGGADPRSDGRAVAAY